jgi:hypothetical protein
MPAKESARQVHVGLARFVAATEAEMRLEIRIDQSRDPFLDEFLEVANRGALDGYISE